LSYPCCTDIQKRLPCIQHVEGTTFDRIFTLIDDNGDPYVFAPNSIPSFVLRNRIDSLIASFTATLLPQPGQVQIRLDAAATVGRVGRFVWSGIVDSAGVVVAMAANEFHIVEGVPGESSVDPTPPITPPTPGGNGQNHSYIPMPGQTVFTVPFIAANPAKTQVFLNGIKYRYGVHFMLLGATLTWLSPIRLDNTDLLEIWEY
jgi:hypothetical protein